MSCRGVRGATTVQGDSKDAILAATSELLVQMIAANDIAADDVASIIFTATPDLTSAFPAEAVRQLGWDGVPLLCAQEIPVPHALAHCIRILLHWNTNKPGEAIVHVYINGAEVLRPDWSVGKAASVQDFEPRKRRGL